MRIIPSSRQSLSFEWLAVNKVCEFKTMTIPSTKMNHSSIVTIQNFSDYQYNGNANFPSPGQWWWKSAPANFHGEAEIWIPLTTGCAAWIMLRECFQGLAGGLFASLCERRRGPLLTASRPDNDWRRVDTSTCEDLASDKGTLVFVSLWKAFPGRKRRSGQVIHAHKL